MRITMGKAALPLAALIGGALATAAWASDDGGRVGAAAVNPEASFVALMSGDQEVPGPGDPDGSGVGTVTMNATTGQVCTVLDTEDIEPIVLYHIHEGAEGVAGPIRVDFMPSGGPTTFSTCVMSTPEQVQAIIANPSGYYLNAHTASFMAGAIRGQLVPVGGQVGDLVLLPEPLRAYDSRMGNPPDGPLAVDTSRVVDLTMGTTGDGAQVVALPPGATAAIVTLTVTETGNAGFLRLYSNALVGQPAVSTINWTAAGSDVATTTTVAVDATGKIKVNAGGSGTHFIVDVIGYYTLMGTATI